MPSLERAQCAAKECRSVVGWCSNNRHFSADFSSSSRPDVGVRVGANDRGADHNGPRLDFHRCTISAKSVAWTPRSNKEPEVRSANDAVAVEIRTARTGAAPLREQLAEIGSVDGAVAIKVRGAAHHARHVAYVDPGPCLAAHGLEHAGSDRQPTSAKCVAFDTDSCDE